MKGLPSIRPARLSRKVLIQAAMKDRGVSQADVARAADVSEATVSRVVAGTQRHPRTEAVIAQALGVAVADIFAPLPAEAPRVLGVPDAPAERVA